MPLLCFNPLGIAFPYTGGLFALSAAGCAWAVARDRARSSGLAMWWLGSGLLLALAPLSLFPYQPAVRLQPRMFLVLMLPGAVLAAAFMDQVLAPRFPRSARVTAVLGALLALACSARIHQDAVRWRRGPEWAHGQLSGFPGVPVVTDWRTAQMLRMLSGETGLPMPCAASIPEILPPLPERCS